MACFQDFQFKAAEWKSFRAFDSKAEQICDRLGMSDFTTLRLILGMVISWGEPKSFIFIKD